MSAMFAPAQTTTAEFTRPLRMHRSPQLSVAAITVTNAETGAKRDTVSNNAGSYVLIQVLDLNLRTRYDSNGGILDDAVNLAREVLRKHGRNLHPRIEPPHRAVLEH